MFTYLSLRCRLSVNIQLIRCVASKKKFITSATPVVRHNWLEMTMDDLTVQDSPSFNNRLIQYLSDSIKTPLTTEVYQHLIKSFENWSSKEFYDLVSVLGSYGLQPIDVICFLTNLPSADKDILAIEKLKQSFDNLLKLKFDSTTRSILVSNDPNIIRYEFDYLHERFDVLMCYFTKREISKLVRTHKQLFSENWSELDYKINYFRIMLFASTRDIVESGALAHSIDHIRQRYLFVYRAGLFKRVRREEQYVVQRDLNISLLDIFSTSLSTFLKRTTNNLLRKDDYQAFVDSLAYESFDDEFRRYLTLEKQRKNWTSADAYAERRERRYWMSEFDMYNNEEQDVDENDEQENKTSLIISKSVENSTSNWHPLSNYSRDRKQNQKIRLNIDPNIRI